MEAIRDIVIDWFTRAHPATQSAVLLGLLGAMALLMWFSMRGRAHLVVVRKDLERAQADLLPLKTDVERLREDLSARERALGESREKCATLEEEAQAATKRAEDLEERIGLCEADAAALKERLDALGQLDADIWMAPSPASSPPPFVARSDRRAQVVAFLNIKGGVGKTTLAANLGTALATGFDGTRRRVLLVDLDNQGTLSNMCVTGEELRYRRVNGFTAEQLIEGDEPSGNPQDLLRRLCAPVGGTHGDAEIVVSYESLDHADFRQQANFVARKVEVRFHHRRVFHDPSVAGRFDFVLLDCPPRLTTSCMNALMAADHIVVPTAAHPNDVDAVPRLLRWLDKLRQAPTFQARLRGIIVNRTYRKGTLDDLTVDESNQIGRLRAAIQEHSPGADPIFRNLVPHKPEVARWAGGCTPLGTSELGAEIYGPVLRELLERLGG